MKMLKTSFDLITLQGKARGKCTINSYKQNVYIYLFCSILTSFFMRISFIGHSSHGIRSVYDLLCLSSLLL